MVAFATLQELQDRLDWDLSESEKRDAEGALEDASEYARSFGKASWTDAENAPRLVRTLVLTAVKRYIKNPDGYTQSRAGDETVAWNDIGDKAGAPYYTQDEIKMLRGLAGNVSGFFSAPLVAHDPRKARRSTVVYVPVDYTGLYVNGHNAVEMAGDFFPMFDESDIESGIVRAEDAPVREANLEADIVIDSGVVVPEGQPYVSVDVSVSPA